ncbi:MAG TPA: DUF1697 domain-containing protein [Woeseiaceae bacterium]|nr:DUF1697 domain-containing protein [Woeseiaceae bacterium]
MATCIAFFRGINVGGRNRLTMKELVLLFEKIGIRGSRTYIQSGNVAFRCTRQQRPEIARRIATAVQQEHGFEPKVQVITIQELEHAIAANPFMDARKDPSNLHLWFLREVPQAPDLEALERLKAPTERFELDKKVFYLHAPDGIGQSKLAAAVEKCLGTDATARNWQTVTKTLELGWDLA